MALNASVAVGGNRQAGNARKMCGDLASECIEESDDVRYIVIAQCFTELQARHDAHCIVQLGHRSVMKIRRCHGHIAQLRHLENIGVFRFLGVVELAFVAAIE